MHPHFDKYEEHLTVLVEGKLYEYKTTKGKLTYRIYGLDRFMEDAGRDTSAESGSKVQQLMKSALVSPSNYENIEKELLEELILKYSSIIGSGESINAIKQLRK